MSGQRALPRPAARREAQAAEIVIINHHLLMADLVLKEEGFGELLPGADAVVIDEAHQLPDVATQFLGLSVSSRQLQALARDVVAELMLLSSVDGAAGAWAQTFERVGSADAESAIRVSGERVDVADWPAAFVEAFELLVADLRSACVRCSSRSWPTTHPWLPSSAGQAKWRTAWIR